MHAVAVALEAQGLPSPWHTCLNPSNSPESPRLPGLRALAAVPDARDALKVVFREHRVVVDQQGGALELRQWRVRQALGSMLPPVEAEGHLQSDEDSSREKISVSAMVPQKIDLATEAYSRLSGWFCLSQPKDTCCRRGGCDESQLGFCSCEDVRRRKWPLKQRESATVS